jgi:hypothetical protein
MHFCLHAYRTSKVLQELECKAKSRYRVASPKEKPEGGVGTLELDFAPFCLIR